MFKSSEVFNYMNDEAIKSEDDEDDQSNTAFLQRSNRSKLSSTEEWENLDDIALISTNVPNDENSYDSNEDLPELYKCDKINDNSYVEIDTRNSTFEENKQSINIDDNYIANEQVLEGQEKIKKQILNIQNQLQKLSNLPIIIQTAIGDIANQVSDLIPEIQGNYILKDDAHDLNSYENSLPLEDNGGELKLEIVPITMSNDKETLYTHERECEKSDEEDQLICFHVFDEKEENKKVKIIVILDQFFKQFFFSFVSLFVCLQKNYY